MWALLVKAHGPPSLLCNQVQMNQQGKPRPPSTLVRVPIKQNLGPQTLEKISLVDSHTGLGYEKQKLMS